MAQQLKFTIYWRKHSFDLGFPNPWVEYHVDEYETRGDIKYLYLKRYNGENVMYNLNDIMAYFFDIEKEK